MRRRVVITGMGVVTPLGHSVDDTFAALLAGKSGIERTTHFDASTFPTKFAAEVKGFDLAKFLPATAGRYADSGRTPCSPSPPPGKPSTTPGWRR